MRKHLQFTRYAFLLLAATIVTGTPLAHAQTINTIAGTSTAGYSGDGGLATSAKINGPNILYIDQTGEVYFCDAQNNRVRKISNTGIITTVAGNGTAGFSGDGGPATSAQFNNPSGLVKDAIGNLYVADQFNHRVRKIDLSGNISTIAGTGVAGFSGDGSAATLAKLYNPYGLAMDSHGNLYISDQYNHAIRKISTTGIISTIAGTGTSGYSGDGAAATAAKLSFPTGVWIDPSDNIFICDNGNHRIRKVNTAGIISTLVGNGTAGFSGDGGAATSAQLQYPSAIKGDGIGNLIISDAGNNRVRKVSTTGIITTISGTGSAGYSGDGGAATLAQLNQPLDVAFGNTGNMYIADFNNSRVRMVDIGNTRVQFANSNVVDTVCKNSGADHIDSLLTATDSNVGQTISWVLHSAPLHGTASISHTTSSTGSTLMPSGLTYTPTAGYVGIDSFVVWINDGFSIDTATVHVTVVDCHVAVNNITKQAGAINVYPNPNNGTFTVNIYSSNDEEVKVTVSDILGNKVKDFTVFTNKPTDIVLSNAAGIYIINAYTVRNKYTTRILVR